MKPISHADAGARNERVRLDKWLWAARFFKTRGLSADEIGKGRVQVNGQVAKASREVRVGDTIELKQGVVMRTVVVNEAGEQRGSATVAQGMFTETPESIERRTRQALERRMNTEPAMAIEQGRPTKRDRRQLADWDRWSASVEPE
jgi:ribosome-associated heat shock protein Hsp15